MPIEGSKAQISRDLGLDFGAYIQGKSFNRSVSTSESGSVDAAQSSTLDESRRMAFPASARRVVSGSDAMSEPSPSPLSSATATISPESPIPPSSCSLFTNAHDLLAGEESSASNNSNASAECIFQPKVTLCSPHPCCSQSDSQQIRTTAYLPDFSVLFQNPVSHRTVTLLSHLIDSRLSPEWRGALIGKSAPSTSSVTLRTDVVPPDSVGLDSTDSASLRRCVPPIALSPSDDVAINKRFKLNDGSVEFGSRSYSSSLKVEAQPAASTDTTCPLNSSFVSPRLVECVRRLTDHFESRYRDKLGDLLEDVARLSVSPSETESCLESTTDDGNTTPESSVARTGPVSDNSTILIFLRLARCRFHQVLSELFRERINWGRVVAMMAFLRALCEHVETGEETCSPLSATSGDATVTGASIPEVYRDVNHGMTPEPVLSSNQTNSVSPSTETSQEPLESTQPHVLTANGGEIQSNAVELRAVHYVAWTAEFIHGSPGIWDWIVANGGWDGLIKFESERGIGESITVGDRIIAGFTEDDAMRLLRHAVTGVATLAVGAVGLVAALRFFTKRL